MDKYGLKKFFNRNTEIETQRKYDKHTIHSPNFFARYTHQKRFKKCVEYIIPMLGTDDKLLDYGCGTGVFISLLNRIKPGCAFGYEPYNIERFEKEVPIESTYEKIKEKAPYQIITIFEVIEHLSDDSLLEFLSRCDEILETSGKIIISVPIELGPVLIIKEFYRLIYSKSWQYKMCEFLKAVFFCIAGQRIGDGLHGYASHKGFDFRRVIRFFKDQGYNITVFDYGPLPIKTWYGNSQIFFSAEKQKGSSEPGR
jgi:2-polyprenyl-3-methyl-5-hydroxy-6-metoxy-1,4-benzoquinol methylase